VTALVGGSVILISLAAVALGLGWLGVEPALVWVSIVSSIAAAVLLALGYARARTEMDRAVRAEDAAHVAVVTPVLPAPADDGAGDEPEEDAAPVLEAPPSAAVDDATRPFPAAVPVLQTPAQPRPFGVEDASPDDAASDRVVAIEGGKRYHRSTCRFAQSKSAMEMSRGDASERGYLACSICKP
jgi:hypothetical protein